MLLPTISFMGNCDEAITFYKEAIGAEVKEIAYFRDAPPNSGMGDLPPNFVMHSEIKIFGTSVTMTDGAKKPISDDYFSFIAMFDTAEEVTSVFNKLADGGQVTDALAPQFWSSLCGNVTDRFGISWHVCMNS